MNVEWNSKMDLNKDYEIIESKIVHSKKDGDTKYLTVIPKEHFRKKPVCSEPDCQSEDCYVHNPTSENLTHIDDDGTLTQVTVQKYRFKCRTCGKLFTEKLNEKKSYTQEFREYLINLKKKGWSRKDIIEHLHLSSATERKLISEYYEEKRNELEYELPYFLGIGYIKYGKKIACLLFDIWESKLLDIVDVNHVINLPGRENVGEIYLVNLSFVWGIREVFPNAMVEIPGPVVIQEVEDALVRDAKSLDFGNTKIDYEKLIKENDEKEIGKAVMANPDIIPILTTAQMTRNEEGTFRLHYSFLDELENYSEYYESYQEWVRYYHEGLKHPDPRLNNRTIKEFLKRSRAFINKMEKDKRVNLDFYTQIGLYLFSDKTEKAIWDKQSKKIISNGGLKI